MFLHDYGDIFSLQNKADKSASNSLNPSIFEGLVTLCAPDAVCFSRHIPHASGRILAERFCVIGTLRSNFLLHKKDPAVLTAGSLHLQIYMRKITHAHLLHQLKVRQHQSPVVPATYEYCLEFQFYVVYHSSQ